MATIQPPALNQTLLVSGSTTATPRLQLGQQIHATVLSTRNGDAELQTSAGTVNAKTAIPLRIGEQLTLTVSQLQPTLTLSLKPPTPPRIEAIAQRLYPKQQPLQQLLQNLSTLLHGSNTSKSSQDAIRQLLQQLPTLLQLTHPKTVKKQIAQSGSFLENHLLKGKPPPAGDLKQQLLLLREKILNSPGEEKVVRQIESMVARIELGQLKSLQGHAPAESTPKETMQRNWVIELPFTADGEPHNAELHLQQHQNRKQPDQQSWHIELIFSLVELGEIHAHATIKGEKIDIHFLTERRESAALISDNLERLEAALSSAGLEIGTLFSRQQSRDNLHHFLAPEAGFATSA